MKKTVTAIVALAAVSAASFWFGQRSGMEDFSRCLEAGGVPVGFGYAAQEPLDHSDVVGKWRLISNEDISRVFAADGTYQDFYGEYLEGDLGRWKIVDGRLAASAEDEMQNFAFGSSPEGLSTLSPIGGDPFDGFAR